MKIFIVQIKLFILLIGSFSASYSQIFTGTGGAISNDSLPNFYSQNLVMGNTYIDSTYGIYGVSINISHTFDGDLNIFLVAPNNFTVELSTKNGGSGDHYTNCIFTANTTAKITSAAPPFSGSFKPEGSLGSVNNGQNPNGVWKLLIVDSKKSSDAGILLNWGLIFSSNPSKLVPFVSSNLPLMLINTFNQNILDEPKINARMRIISHDTSLNYIHDSSLFYNHKITIESRGSSSQSFAKKPYGFFTVDASGADSNTTLLDLPSEHNWVLNASYNDKSLMRDMLTYELARRTGRYASRYQYCELFINGKYEGVYLLMEKVKRDANRVDIAKLKPEDTTGNNLTGGYIVKIDKTTGNYSGGWTDSFPTYPGSTQRVFFQYDYPEEAVMPPQQRAYIKNYIYLFENALYGAQFMNPINGYRQYADVGSFIDYSIMNEISKNVDGYRLSTYLFKDKDSKGGKLSMGPIWDFTIAWSNANYNNSVSPIGWEIDLTSGAPFWWKRFRLDTGYVNTFYCRWNELRQSTLSINNINNILDSNLALTKDAAFRNFQRWPILGQYIWPNPTPLSYTYEDEIYALKSWINQRLLWMDNQLVVNCNSVTNCKPKVVLSAEKMAICKNQSVKLYADGIGSTFTWWPAIGLNTVNGRNVIATLDTTRTYRVIMQTHNGCVDTGFITITVLPLPSKSNSGNTSICRGQSAILSASTGAAAYKWTPTSTLDTANGSSVKATPTFTTTYKVVVYNSLGCSDSSYITVVVNTKPTVTITPSQDSACRLQSMTLTASGGSTYRWLPANGLNDSVGATVMVNPLVPTTYQVIGSNTQGCTDTAAYEIIFYPAAPIKISSNRTQICVGETVTLLASGGLNLYWLPTNGFSGSSNSSISVSPNTSTIYQVTGINIHGCIDTSFILISVYPIPKVVINSVDTILCMGNTATLTAQGATTYRWLPSPGLNDSIGDRVLVTPSSTTSYTVIGINPGGCLDTSRITIQVVQNPKAKITGNNIICKGQSTTLNATGGNTYRWYPALGLNTTSGAQVIASPTSSTVYHGIAESVNLCRDTVQFQIMVLDVPIVMVSPAAPTITKGKTVVLVASGAKTYQWSPAYGLNTTIGNTVSASPAITTNYQVTGTDSNLCSTVKTVAVLVDATGVKNIENNGEEFIILPNPVEEELTIIKIGSMQDALKDGKETEYQICDLAGKTLRKGWFNDTPFVLNVSSLSAGVYYLKISTPNHAIWVKRMTKK